MSPLSESPIRDAEHVMLGLCDQLREQYGETPSGSLVATYISLPPDLNDLDFDEALYLELYPDVAECVRGGSFRSGYEHWILHGKHEGRRRRLGLLESLQRIAYATSQAQEQSTRIGQVPQGPPTLRARFGALLARAVQRTLAGYTASLHAHIDANQLVLTEQARLLAVLASTVSNQNEELQALRAIVVELQDEATSKTSNQEDNAGPE